MAARKLALGEVLTGASGASLLVAVFALDWFSFVDPANRRAAEKLGLTQASVPSLHSDGWHALPAPRWALLATSALCAACVWTGLRASVRVATRLDLVLLVVAVTSAALVIFRVLDPPGRDELATVEAGAYAGLASTLAAAAGAYLSIRDQGTSVRAIWTELGAESNASRPARSAAAAPPEPPPADPDAPRSIPPPGAPRG
jgi:hypothetical protein